jgi:hypothetical protein
MYATVAKALSSFLFPKFIRDGFVLLIMIQFINQTIFSWASFDLFAEFLAGWQQCFQV